MADDKELQVEDGKGKSKMMIIIIAVVVLAAGGAGAFFFLGGKDDAMMEDTAAAGAAGANSSASSSGSSASAELGSAMYVAMPRPFTFNIPGTGRDRLVQIKVQLMVRGSDNEEASKMHIPSIEGALLQVFSSANADDLATEPGKVALRNQALESVQTKMQDIVGRAVVEQVLFTGFVMQ